MARTVGVEEEFLLVDARYAQTRGRGDAVVEGVKRASTDDAAGEEEAGLVEHELKREQVESASPPCEVMAELSGHLRRLRQRLARAADQEGCHLVAMGTSPMPTTSRMTQDDRYGSMAQEFGFVSRQQLTCGTHVHVAVRSREEGVQILDRIRPWLSPLLALSANSPLWQGEDTGYASYRSIMWGTWPTAGPTERFGSLDAYEKSVDDLVRSGAALDRGMVYFDARLSDDNPTLEIRICDVCARVEDAVLIAALCRGIVETAARQAQEDRPVVDARAGLLRAAAWRAARHGLGGQLVDVEQARLVDATALLDQLVTHIGEALADDGDLELVQDGLARLRSDGTGADLSRTAFAAHESTADVLAAAAQLTVA